MEQVNVFEDEIKGLLPEVEGAAQIVRSALERGQGHLFENWKQRGPDYREALVRQLARIDWEVFDQALEILRDGEKLREYAEDEVHPVPMRTHEEQQADSATDWEAGRQSLIEGKVAWLVPAGGSGSRLVKMLPEIYASLPFKRRYKVADEQMKEFDADCAKGQLPITPVLGKTFYGLFMEQALAIGARVQRMPVLIFMLSDETREASLTTITTHKLFSKLEPAMVMFDHGMNPVLDNDGKIIPYNGEGRLVFSGNGNGGMFKAMRGPGYKGGPNIFERLDADGIQVVGFSNVDNPVADIITPRMLGSHVLRGARLTFGVVKKAFPMERVGMIVHVDGQENLEKIEYNEFPEALARRTQPGDPSRLLFEHGDVNVFLMDLAEMEAVVRLPLKMYSGKTVKTANGGRAVGNKFESFAFHIIRQVPKIRVDVKEILRAEQFMPTKNSIGRDSPATVIRALCTRNMHWLERQGARVATQSVDGCLVDLQRLMREMVEPSASGTAFQAEAAALSDRIEKARAARVKVDIDSLCDSIAELGDRAQGAKQEELKSVCDHVFSVLRPGEAKAFVEFSPCYAMEAEDLAEMGVGEGWVLEEGSQVALTGHPSQVMLGAGFHAKKNSAFILDIHNEYGDILMNDDRWLTFELELAGKAEIGANVTIAEGAELEIHVEGSGKVVIPDGAVIRGNRTVSVPDGETVTVKE